MLIDHGGGWESQYCHMRAGSIAVEVGQRGDGCTQRT
ncbi:M23 family metallopeptidase [Aliiroseovarius sp. PrR006]|nr:M23 family metallopeptidase [Aliiroseovarius sp. PrR006]NDW53196.1 M23 family metallopeptidase [Aliiroseovarius sp. PrR006]